MESYSKAVQRRIDAVDREIQRRERQRDSLKLLIAKLERRRHEIICSESPIQPGAMIEWNRGGRQRVGRVVSVTPSPIWNSPGYRYRVVVLSKAGKERGFSIVETSHEPVLVTRRKASSKSKTKAKAK